MNITFEILRRKSPESSPYTRTVTLDAGVITVAEALRRINAEQLWNDPVEWECSCMQKKCGACAMLINGKPRLACDTKVSGGVVKLAPLRKFPVVRDLLVDRIVMFENLKAVGACLESGAAEDVSGTAYDASRCLQCGCCLEVCPNFYPGGEFFGAAVMVPTSRIIAETTDEERARISSEYSDHFYRGCGKSLSCKDICPAGIDTERLLVNSNAVAVWKRKIKARR